MVYEIFLIFALGIIPGYLLCSLDKKLDDLEKLALSFGISFLVFGGVGLLLHLFGIPLIYSLISIIPICVYVALKKVKLSLNLNKYLVIILVSAFLIRFILQFFFQSPLIGDSYFHMNLGRTFLTDDWFEVNAVDSLWTYDGFPFPEDYRPPFWNFILGFFYSIFGTSFYISKLVSILVGVIVIVPCYLIAKKIGGNKAAILVSTIVAFAPILIGHSFEAEVKIISTYFTVASLYFFLRGKEFWHYTGIMAGLTYLTAYNSGIALVLSFLVCLLVMKRKEIFTRQTLAMGLIFLVVVSPLLIRNYLEFSDPFYSSSKYVTYINSFDEMYTFEKPTLNNLLSLISENPKDFILTKVVNLYRTFFPLPLKLVGSNVLPEFNPITNLNIILRPISMIITMPIMLLALYYILKSTPRILKEKNLLAIYSIISIIIPLALWTPKANLFFLMFPQIFVFAILGSAYFERMKMKNIYRKIIYVVIIVLLLVQSITFVTRQNAVPEIGQQWVLDNTSTDEIIMVRWTDVQLFNLYTDRKILPIPFEDANTIIKFAKDEGVSYLFVDQLDFDPGKITLDDFKQRLKLVDIYEVVDPNGSSQIIIERYIFRVE